MSLTDMVIMPGADYQAACDAIREKTEGVGYIRSGDMAELIRGIETGAGNVQYFTLPMGRSRGDVSGDGVIDILDANMAENSLTDPVQRWCADADGDGAITASDKNTINGFANKLAYPLTSVPTMADYYGNWTWVKVDDTSGYFYYDLEVEGVTAATKVTVLVSEYSTLFLDPICMDGVIRICASLCPPAEVDCCVMFDENEWGSVPVPVKKEYKLVIKNRGNNNAVYLSRNHLLPIELPAKGQIEDLLYEGDWYALFYPAGGRYSSPAPVVLRANTASERFDDVSPMDVFLYGNYSNVIVFSKTASDTETVGIL